MGLFGGVQRHEPILALLGDREKVLLRDPAESPKAFADIARQRAKGLHMQTDKKTQLQKRPESIFQ